MNIFLGIVLALLATVFLLGVLNFFRRRFGLYRPDQPDGRYLLEPENYDVKRSRR